MLLPILRRDKLLPTAPRSRRASINEENHKAATKATATKNAPSNRLSTEVLIAPILILTLSRKSSRSGSKPVAHSATPIQMIQETVCSSTLTQCVLPHRRRTTLATVRMTTKAAMIGKAMRNSDARTATFISNEAE